MTVAAPPAPPSQMWLFQWLRLRLTANGFRTTLADAPIRLVTIFLSVAIVWVAVLGLSTWGMLFLISNQVPQSLIGLLFDLFFLTVACLGIFSTGLILFGTLFKGAETAFLLGLPARADQVFAFKYQTAVGLSSFAFAWLGSPILLVYGVVFEAPWYYYLLLPLFMLGFVLIPGSVGAMVALLVVRFVPNQRRTVLVMAGLVVAAAGGVLVFLLIRAGLSHSVDPLQQVLGYLSFARSPYLPSHWVSRGIQTARWGQWGESLYQLALVWSNGLLLYLATALLAGRTYRKAYDRLTTGANLADAKRAESRKRGVNASAFGRPPRSLFAWADHVVAAMVPFVDPQTRSLIVKDFRTFRREPLQWVQILIFVVLMVLYFSIMRNFYQQDIGKPYQNGVSLLNLSVTGLLMCAYTGRFIYPMLSLEGRKFWLLGLLPLKRERLLWGKFVFSAVGMLLPSTFLIVVSDILLGISPLAIGLHALAMLVLALGLSGLSVGLGAAMPNFSESDPSKIAVGFGGTLNLIASLLYLLVVIGMIAGPFHFDASASMEGDVSEPLTSWWFYVGVLLGLVVGAIATFGPMRLGIRHLERMEF